MNIRKCSLVAALAATPLALCAQEAAPAPSPADTDEDTVVLSPFTVSESSDVGYAARETLGGGRFRTQYKDVSSQVNVMTAEFLSDVGVATLDEAFRFSMNVESENNYFNVQSGSATDTGNPTSPTGGNRTRGLTRSSITHDFFESYVPVDTYNTERFTFVSGANAILFGNGQAGGTIETGFTRADPRKAFGTFESRLNDQGGWRAHFNINQPIIKKTLAVRVAAMRGDEDATRTPSMQKSRRDYYAFTLQPLQQLRIHGYYEKVDIRKILTRPVLIQDKITPWLNSLSDDVRDQWLNTYDPSLLTGLDNSTINSTVSSSNQTKLRSALVAQGFTARNGTSSFGQFSAVSESRVQAVLSADGVSSVPITNWYATAHSEGPEQFGNRAEINNDWSITDPSLYPNMLNFMGNGSQNRQRSEIRGMIVEFNPIKDLTLEFGINLEQWEQPYVDWLQYGQAELHMDINQYLPAAWSGSSVPTRVLNPNFGRYYLSAQPTGGEVANLKEEKRVTALYKLDFTQNKGWSRHLGMHYLTAGWSRQVNQKYEQVVNGGARIISDNTFTTNPASRDINNTNRQYLFRYYIDSPSANPTGNYWLNLPVDPWNPGTIGTDSAGNDVVVAMHTLPYDEYAKSQGLRSGQKQSDSVMASVMSTWFKGRIITTFGVRRDNNQFTNWAGTSQQPRWDGDNNTWFYPTAETPLPSRLNNAPYMDWRALRHAPEYNRLGSTFREDNQYSRLTGIVVHPTEWLTLSYNKAFTSYATDYIRRSMNSEGVPTLDDGRTKDYGITLSLPNDKLSLRLVKYESNLLGRSSSYRDTGVGSPNAKGIRDLIPYVERSYQIATGSKPGNDFAWHYYTDDVADATIPSWSGSGTPSSFGGPRDNFDVISDRTSKGYEATLTANPIEGLRVSLSAAKNETVENNIAKAYFDFIDARIADWESQPDAPIMVNSTSGVVATSHTIQSFMRDWVVPQLNFLKMMEGIPNPSERKYRINFTTRYGWNKGALKGAFLGTSAIYRSRGGIGTGYRAATEEDIVYNYNGVASPQTTLVPDFNQLLTSPSTMTWDFFAGYSFKIAKGKIQWRIQLNVKNLFDEDSLIPLRAQLIDGKQFNTTFNTAEPRQFLLTNSFKF